MFVKANGGYIFGGFNPCGWVSDFTYSESSHAYLFSVTDGQGREPKRLPVRRKKQKYAIKQNEYKYSPGFGEANVADLFIAFKNLQNSYSVVGNVYKMPDGQDPETYLAGRKTDWQIDEIEVW